MAPADKQQSSQDKPAATARIERAHLEAARRRLGLVVDADAPDGGTPSSDPQSSAPPWSACRAPDHVLVINANGSLRACDYGATESATSQSQLTGWSSGKFQKLRESLQQGELPLPHCQGCAQWLQDDLFATAPPLRDYGTLPANRRAKTPSHLVVRFPANDGAPREALVRDLQNLFPDLETITLEGSDVFRNDAANKVLAALRSSAKIPQLSIRTGAVGDADAAIAALEGLALHELELTLPNANAEQISAAGTVTKHCRAGLRVRFVLTPETWFDFADVVLQSAAHGAQADLCILDRDGKVPLQALEPAELSLLRDAVVDHWSRFNDAGHPSSLHDTAFADLCSELLQLLGRRIAASEQDPDSPVASTTPLQLPPMHHNWCHDERPSAWHKRLFSHAHNRSVCSWLLTIDERTAGQTPWLRALMQRVAYENQQPELLDMLRRLYRGANTGQLQQEDEAIVETFELHSYGGPWNGPLGLNQQGQRARAFPIGSAVAPSEDAQRDVTVLIPSYRHEQFIGETIRSVLAQDYANFEVLVADDRSPDETVAQAQQVDDPRVRVEVNERNLGLGNSLLHALESIKTPFVAILNSDDLLHPEHLGACRDALIGDESVQVVATDIQAIDSDGGMLNSDSVSLVLDGKQVFDWIHWYERIRPADVVPPADVFGELLERNYLVTSSNLVVRTEWLRAQADSLRSLKYCLDWRLFLQAALEGALLHIPRPLVAYRLHASNTVWFESERRDGYFLEVHRVAAEALEGWTKNTKRSADQQVVGVLDAVAKHVHHNSEVDGFAMFLNAALDPLALDRNIADSPSCRDLLSELSSVANQRRLATGAANGTEDQLAPTRLRTSILGELAQWERGQRRWLQVFSSGQMERIEELGRLTDKIWQEKQDLEQRSKDERQEFQQRIEKDHREFQKRSEDARREWQKRSEESDRVTKSIWKEKQDLEQRKKQLTEQIAQQEQTKARLTQELEELTRKHQTTSEDLQRALEEKRQLNEELADAVNHQQRLQAELSATLKRLSETEVERDNAKTLAREQQRRISTLTNQRQELAATLSGREFQIGNFIWNKLPLAWTAGRLKKWFRRLKDLKTRLALKLHGRSRANQNGAGIAVVTATRNWPIYSHTFVYQEMLGLAEIGLRPRLFYWDTDDINVLHEAFASLSKQRVQIQHHWGNHKRDFRHFEKTRPQRLQSFLQRIADLSGKSVETVSKDGMILRACTFARLVELSGARYLHSYFFYDQSFMTMMTAWLLEIPRGISCYADHMLDDYPWKFVPLNIELADLVVATSARIKRELSELSDGQYDDKIMVKPNGVDGRRFPAVQRPPRAPDEPFEVISVSRLEPKKGLTHLVEAVAELKRRGHHVIAHVIGSEDPHSSGSIEYADLFRRRIEQLDVQGQVILHGMLKQETMAPIIAKSRAFVAPYIEVENGDKDGIPTAMLEAMASNLPVVTTDSGSIQEVIDHEVEGLIVAQRDSIAFADAIEKLLTDPALERRMATAARARFEKQFDIQVTEQQLHDRIRAITAAKA